jgi:hypothetical protein
MFDLVDRPAGTGFEEHVRVAAQDLRAALAEALTSVEVDPTRPQVVSKRLGLDKSLSWKVSRLIGDKSAAEIVSHLPGRAGLRILQEAVAKAGAPEVALATLRDAIDGFDRMVEIHCGDRETLEIMMGFLHREGDADRDELHRRKSFQGNSAIWGVQARIRLSAYFIAPSRGSDSQLDLAVVGGLVDLRRLRPNTPWAIATLRSYADDGSLRPSGASEPIDEAVKPGEAPLIHEFCSQPLPPMQAVPGPNQTLRYEVADGPVGNTALITCLVGWVVRRDVSRFAGDGQTRGEHLTILNTPAELLVHDLFVHRGTGLPMPPSVHLYSQLPGGPTYPNCGPDQGEMDVREPMIDLGASPPDLVLPEMPRYRALVEKAVSRIGWSINDFAGYRVRMRYPPIPSSLLFRHPLLER